MVTIAFLAFTETFIIFMKVMSNSCNPTSTLSNTAEIAENESSYKLSPLQWSKFKPIVGLTSHSAGVLKIT